MTTALVTVGQYQFLPEADAALMYLEMHGFQCFLADAETVNMDWFLGNAIGYIKLQVPRDQAEGAQAILDQAPSFRDGPGEERTPEPEVRRCLECGIRLSIHHPGCPACGAPYTTQAKAIPAQEEIHEQDEEGSGTLEIQGRMETLRAWKRPIFLLMWSPVVLLVGWPVMVFLVAFVSWFARMMVP